MFLENQKLIRKEDFSQNNRNSVKLMASNALMGLCSLSSTVFSETFTAINGDTVYK
jgi:hypothetical protein